MEGTIPPCSYRFCTIYAHLNIMAFYAIIFSKEFISLRPLSVLSNRDGWSFNYHGVSTHNMVL